MDIIFSPFTVPFHTYIMMLIAVVAERLRPLTSIPEVPGSNPGPAVASLGKALYPHCLVLRRRLSAVGPVYRRLIPYMFARKITHITSRKKQGEIAGYGSDNIQTGSYTRSGGEAYMGLSYQVNFSPPWQTRRLPNH